MGFDHDQPSTAKRKPSSEETPTASIGQTVLEPFLVFLRLGLTSFGGPIAHLGYFEREIIERRKWLTQNAYGDLVALCQFLPGPASSQVAFALGYLRSGIGGAFAAIAGFTVPSAVLMIAIAYGFQAMLGPLFTFSAYLGTVIGHSWFSGLWCLVWIFLPSFLLLLGALPYWSSLRQNGVRGQRCEEPTRRLWESCLLLFTIPFGQSLWIHRSR
jgi:hypothetical protein